MIGESIKRLRQARNMSQVELAFHLNVTKQSVSNWENNNILPSIEMLVKIAKFFSVSTDYILGLDNRDYILVVVYYLSDILVIFNSVFDAFFL